MPASSSVKLPVAKETPLYSIFISAKFSAKAPLPAIVPSPSAAITLISPIDLKKKILDITSVLLSKS